MTDPFATLASDHHLEDRSGRSPDDLAERYLYSSDMVFRYAFDVSGHHAAGEPRHPLSVATDAPLLPWAPVAARPHPPAGR